MGFKEILISAILVGLIVICLLQFANQSAVDNNANRSIMQDTALANALSNLTSSVNNVYPTSETQLNSTSAEQPSLSFGSLVMFSIVGATRIFTGTITTLYQSIFILVATMGIPPIVIQTFFAIILIVVILSIWRTIRIGS
jgi:hypothetical protein